MAADTCVTAARRYDQTRLPISPVSIHTAIRRMMSRYGMFGQLFAQELGSEVGAILPGEGIVANDKPTKKLYIFQRFKNRTIQFTGKINLTTGTIIEFEPHLMFAEIFGLYNVWNHNITPVEKSH